MALSNDGCATTSWAARDIAFSGCCGFRLHGAQYNIISNKHPDMLALNVCTLQRGTGTEHMYCGGTARESRGLISSSD